MSQTSLAGPLHIAVHDRGWTCEKCGIEKAVIEVHLPGQRTQVYCRGCARDAWMQEVGI